MRRAMRAAVLLATVALVCAPVQARADGYVSPWAGVNFSQSQPNSGDRSWGVNAGYMGAGIIGGELEFGWAPDYFRQATTSRVWDLMGNLIVGVPVGGTHGPGIRPYVTAGLGNIHQQFQGLSPASKFSDNDLGYNLGAGALGYFSDHVGLRGDVRYLRNFNTNPSDAFDIAPGTFHFWRGSVGVVIR